MRTASEQREPSKAAAKSAASIQHRQLLVLAGENRSVPWTSRTNHASYLSPCLVDRSVHSGSCAISTRRKERANELITLGENQDAQTDEHAQSPLPQRQWSHSQDRGHARYVHRTGMNQQGDDGRYEQELVAQWIELENHDRFGTRGHRHEEVEEHEQSQCHRSCGDNIDALIDLKPEHHEDAHRHPESAQSRPCP